MRPKVLRAGLLSGAIMCALLPAGPASAAAAVLSASSRSVDLDCEFVVSVQIAPGITPTPQLSVFDSGGLTGQATCTGKVLGKNVTGPGAVSLRAEETASCAQLEGGHGVFTFRVPIAGGFAYIFGTYNSGGDGITGGMTGTAAVVSIDAGDCFNTPVTGVTTRAEVHVGPVYS
ncbi:hypothetical protein Vqi01_18920 [Micromonospora qiuiae]|uniref:Uncharacterized protein n=1 Tax=Micromonospora qiuiae TaxID=502268 RepID=A0ABQ4J990_9ACTN|nr:hypothetical protein [Micromonospora qiuiae]GIJ26730.1 hypothetical protein Vqi01_18920 [Micromonospora qiuiae]